MTFFWLFFVLKTCLPKNVLMQYMNALQTPTGKYRGLQGNPCNETRDPAMRRGVKFRGVSCNENRFFPVRIDSQGVPCELCRVWVCSVVLNTIISHTFIPNFQVVVYKAPSFFFLKYVQLLRQTLVCDLLRSKKK